MAGNYINICLYFYLMSNKDDKLTTFYDKDIIIESVLCRSLHISPILHSRYQQVLIYKWELEVLDVKLLM